MDLVNQETQVFGEMGMQSVIAWKRIASTGPHTADFSQVFGGSIWILLREYFQCSQGQSTTSLSPKLITSFTAPPPFSLLIQSNPCQVLVTVSLPGLLPFPPVLMATAHDLGAAQRWRQEPPSSSLPSHRTMKAGKCTSAVSCRAV